MYLVRCDHSNQFIQSSINFIFELMLKGNNEKEKR